MNPCTAKERLSELHSTPERQVEDKIGRELCIFVEEVSVEYELQCKCKYRRLLPGLGEDVFFAFRDATLQHCHVDERLNHRRMAETSIDCSHKSTGKATYNTHAHSMNVT